MHLKVIGINHESAPVGIRERVSVQAGQIDDVLDALKSHAGGGIVLSTCNRTEVYCVETENSGENNCSSSFIKNYFGLSGNDLMGYTYEYTDREAVDHLFRVTCGLDSMVIGEYEVLGQVRNALECAEKAQVMNLPLRRLFQDAVRIGRQVREETGISNNALSVSSVAVELAAMAVGDLSQKEMLLIGAGEAGRLVAQAARDKGDCRIKVANRTFERAQELAGMLGGQALGVEHIIRELETTDLVVTCADAPHMLITKDHIDRILHKRNGTPLVIIDIAVPRNVDHRVADNERVFLYNVDDLNKISEQNRRIREGEKEKAEAIIEKEVGKFDTWWQEYEVRPIITALMNKAHEIRTAQLKRTLKKLPPLNEEQQYSLDKMTEAIVINLLKDPINTLKENAGDTSGYINAARILFKLETEDSW